MSNRNTRSAPLTPEDLEIFLRHVRTHGAGRYLLGSDADQRDCELMYTLSSLQNHDKFRRRLGFPAATPTARLMEFGDTRKYL